jgi:pyrimidine deaminase RibD-like protein/SAM-dependent methyltransferase
MYDQKRALELMAEAIKEAAASVPEDYGAHPKVGAILADSEGKIIARSHRGETGKGDHAEFILLTKASETGYDLSKAVLFVTLEPCTGRGPGKRPCAERIVESGISRVHFGMLDPNPQICGRGETLLRFHGLDVERFPSNLIREIEELNSQFIDEHKAAHLPSSSLFVQLQISDLIIEHLRRNGIEVDDIPTDWDITLEDVLPRLDNQQSSKLPILIREARRYAYDKKYGDKMPDFRGIEGHWKNEVRNILATLGAPDFSLRHIIDVGIGNGIEAVGLLDTAQHITAVDIAPKSLKHAQRRLPQAKFIANEAENLRDIPKGSQDLYISLRTYQSSYFDITAAIREAYRVIRQGGLIIISVVNGYSGPGGALISGMLFPRSNIVDRDRPYEVIDQIRRKLTVLRFEEIGIRTGFAEIYVYGRRGR